MGHSYLKSKKLGKPEAALYSTTPRARTFRTRYATDEEFRAREQQRNRRNEARRREDPAYKRLVYIRYRLSALRAFIARHSAMVEAADAELLKLVAEREAIRAERKGRK